MSPFYLIDERSTGGVENSMHGWKHFSFSTHRNKISIQIKLGKASVSENGIGFLYSYSVEG